MEKKKVKKSWKKHNMPWYYFNDGKWFERFLEKTRVRKKYLKHKNNLDI